MTTAKTSAHYAQDDGEFKNKNKNKGKGARYETVARERRVSVSVWFGVFGAKGKEPVGLLGKSRPIAGAVTR
jgi:hypothetical protein